MKKLLLSILCIGLPMLQNTIEASMPARFVDTVEMGKNQIYP